MDRQRTFVEFENLFWDISRKMGYIWKHIYVQTFPGSQSHIMYLLDRDGAKKMSELADALHITAGAITTASDQLIKQGYVARIRDEKDRRVVHLELTEKGARTINALQHEGREKMRSLFNEATDADIERITAIFKQATTQMDHLSKEYET